MLLLLNFLIVFGGNMGLAYLFCWKLDWKASSFVASFCLSVSVLTLGLVFYLKVLYKWKKDGEELDDPEAL